MNAPSRRALQAGLALIGTATLIVIFYSARIRTIDKLARGALRPEYPRPTTVDRLASYRGVYATRALLSIAMNDQAPDDNSAAAIRALGRRSDREISPALATKLRPDVDLFLRGVVSEVISTRECGSGCMESILEYLQRRFWGEKTGEENLDEHVVDPSEVQLEQSLRAILMSHPLQLRTLLAQRFGLRNGSRAPSPFAIDLVSRLGLKSSCADLHSSHAELEKFRARNIELLNDLAAAEQRLACLEKSEPIRE